MADKMMRVAGRSNSGQAIPLQINTNGGVKTDEVKRHMNDSLVTIAPGTYAVVANLQVEDYRFLNFAANIWASTGAWLASLDIVCFNGDTVDSRIYLKDFVKISSGNVHTPYNSTLSTVDEEEIFGKRVEVRIHNRGTTDININRKDITLFKTSATQTKTLGIPFNFKLTIDASGEIPHLSDNVSASKIMITADANNVNPVRIAPSQQALNGAYPLAHAKPLHPGEWTTWEIRNLRFLGVRGTTGDVIYVEGVL